MDAFNAFLDRPLVRQIPPPGFESSSGGGGATTMYTNPFNSTASSWSFGFTGGDLGRRTHPISLSDLCDDYFPRPTQLGPFPTMNVPHEYYVPRAVGELPATPAVPPAGGFILTPDYTKKLCCLYDGYDEEIEATLRGQEDEAKAKPSPDYLETTQGGRMSQDTRAALVGWMKLFTQCYGLAPAMLHRAVSCVDRFLSVQPLADVGMRWLRLLGAAAVYAAAKYEDQRTAELGAAEIASYCRLCGGGAASSKEEVLDMERALLVALDYRLGRPTAYTFVEHFTRHYGQEEARLELRSCAHDFADMSLFHYSCLQHSPSAVAAAAMFLARLTLKPTYGQMKCWNRELKDLTGYEPIELERCVEAIHSLIPQHGDGSYDDVDLFPMFYAIADPS